jgi:DNA-binding response OmpR family regulator
MVIRVSIAQPFAELDTAELVLGPREEAILAVLRAQAGRVVTRTQLARVAGLAVSSRRLDVHLVNVRRVVGPENLTNVRSRGWMLNRSN